MEEKDNLFLKGFNCGYLIAKHNSELLEKILKNPNPESVFYQGIVNGKKEYYKEKIRTFSKEEKKEKVKTQTKSIKFSREKER